MADDTDSHGPGVRDSAARETRLEGTSMGQVLPLRRERPAGSNGGGRGRAGDAASLDEDERLVERAQAGDQRAFSRLFEKHHGRVWAMCRRLLRGDDAAVEDAVQQTFLEAWRSLHRFEGRSRFTTWITRIAIHTCLGFRRKLKRLFLLEDGGSRVDDARPIFGAAERRPDDGATARARKAAVLEVLHQLSEKRRVVFLLADLEGMTAPEISEVLGIPDATVRTRLFHARKDFAAKAQVHPGFADLFAGASAEGADP